MLSVRIAIIVWLSSAVAAGAATRTAATCSAPDVQAAINASATGDAVVIPAGSCTWTSGVTISGKGIVLQGVSPGAVTITNGAVYGVDVTEDGTFHTEISKLTVTGTGVFIRILPRAEPTDTGKAVLVHHLTLKDTAGIRAEVNRGVFWSNTITAANTIGSNLEFVQCKPLGLTSSWTSSSTMGTADVTGESNLYIEDNTFTKVLQAAIDVDDNCRVVIRHNVFDNSALGSHGADTSSVGGRHFELYDNTFTFTNFGECNGSQTANVPFFFFLRGGTGVITNNTGLTDMSSCAWGNKPALNFTVMNLQRDAGPNPCWGAGTSGGSRYHAPRQIGMGRVTGAGKDGLGRATDSMTYVGDSEPLYIWDQSGPLVVALSDYGPSNADSCSGTTDLTRNYVVPGRDFFVDGTAKPGWTRFAYPHPLRVRAPSPPASPANVRIKR